MTALFQENIDGTYSLHFKEEELELLVTLLSVTRFGNKGYDKAAFGMYTAIEDVLGNHQMINIQDAIPAEIEYDDDNDWCIHVGED